MQWLIPESRTFFSLSFFLSFSSYWTRGNPREEDFIQMHGKKKKGRLTGGMDLR